MCPCGRRNGLRRSVAPVLLGWALVFVRMDWCRWLPVLTRCVVVAVSHSAVSRLAVFHSAVFRLAVSRLAVFRLAVFHSAVIHLAVSRLAVFRLAVFHSAVIHSVRRVVVVSCDCPGWRVASTCYVVVSCK